ncbi:hypothetical protein B0T24DRAFT_266986 [Lasiosphaeria ovina]|uniref:Uncharacterized protein n=1 Tax=Lasiosphaeria ovina TaxID=92902 RepID=A0AAE0N8N5_9PEZI|nr:hypothetical protein B0T24DRAFT_266986 [Lasiosphaeria ovina]
MPLRRRAVVVAIHTIPTVVNKRGGGRGEGVAGACGNRIVESWTELPSERASSRLHCLSSAVVGRRLAAGAQPNRPGLRSVFHAESWRGGMYLCGARVCRPPCCPGRKNPPGEKPPMGWGCAAAAFSFAAKIRKASSVYPVMLLTWSARLAPHFISNGQYFVRLLYTHFTMQFKSLLGWRRVVRCRSEAGPLVTAWESRDAAKLHAAVEFNSASSRFGPTSSPGCQDSGASHLF